jgi:hypothetical protein
MSTKQLSVSVVRALISCFILFVIFSALPISPPKGPDGEELLKPLQFNNTTADLHKLDVEKITDEIRMRIEQENEWYRYKFLFVGSLLLASVVHLSLFKGRKVTGRQLPPAETRLLQIVQSRATLAVLALALVIALAIDTHIRVGVTSSNIAGLFLYANNCSDWERYLRATGMMHTDWPYMFFYWPHFHFLTLVMYAFYIIGFQYAASNDGSRDNWLPIGGFFLVHITVLYFAVSAHLAPGRLRCTPFDLQLLPWAVVCFFALLSVVLCLPSAPYLRRLLYCKNMNETTATGQSG